MSDQEPSPSPSEYVVVLRALAGFHFGDLENALIIRSFPTPVGRADFLFASRFVSVSGFGKPVRRGLRVEVRGLAPSLIEAVEAFANVAMGLAAVISLCTNIESKSLGVEIAFDDTPGKTEREFFQQYLPEERWMVHSGRPVPREAVRLVLKALGTHTEDERLHRAVTHYHHALQNWELGAETFALAHLYMGMEALTPVACRRHLSAKGITRQELAKLWGIDWTDERQRKGFDPEVRRRLLFEDDDATYSAAKNASDAYEHSFRSIPDVRTISMAVRDQTAKYLRRAILELADVDALTKDVLLSSPYMEPAFWSFTKYVFGTIIGVGDELAAPDQQYPVLRLTSTASEPEEADATLEFQFDEKITPRLAEGLTFRIDRFEVWGPSPTNTDVQNE